MPRKQESAKQKIARSRSPEPAHGGKVHDRSHDKAASDKSPKRSRKQ